MAKSTAKDGNTASQQVDARIASLPDWRGELLAKLRATIRAADQGIVEEWKWDVPVWSHGGIVCTGEVYRQHVKLTFAKGASLRDQKRLFNSSLAGGTRRAIDFEMGDKVDAPALKALVREAIAANAAKRER